MISIVTVDDGADASQGTEVVDVDVQAWHSERRNGADGNELYLATMQ